MILRADYIELKRLIWLQQNMKEILKKDYRKDVKNIRRFVEVDRIKKVKLDQSKRSSFDSVKEESQNKIFTH